MAIQSTISLAWALVGLVLMPVLCGGLNAAGRSTAADAAQIHHSVPAVTDHSVQTPSSEVAHLDVDLNGDGRRDKARIVLDGKLTLFVGGAHTTIASKYVDGALPPHTEITLTPMSVKAPIRPLLVSIDWAVNKIGSETELWLYNYEKGKLILRWSLADEQPQVKTTKVDNRTLAIHIPAYKLRQNLRLDDESLKRLKSHAIDSKDPLMQADLIGISTPTAYAVGDFTGDGMDEVVVNRLMYLESPPFFPCRLFTVFGVKGGKPVPSAAFITTTPIEWELTDLVISKSGVPTDGKKLLTALKGRTSQSPEIAFKVMRQMVKQGIFQPRNGLYRIKIPSK